VEKAEVADLHNAMRQDRLEEPAEQLPDGALGGAEACPAHGPGGKGDGAVREAHETGVRDGDLEDLRGEGGESGVAVVLRLSVAVPGDGPALGIDGLQQAGLEPGVFAERTGEGGERWHRNQAVGAGGAPGRAVLGEATAGHHGREGRVGREWPPPGRQATREPQELGPAEALSFGELVEGHGRGLKPGLVREPLMRADQGTQGLRDRAGQEKGRPRALVGHGVLEPRLGVLLRPLGAVAVATGMRDAVLPRAVVPRREAVTVRAAVARLDGAEDLTVCGGERRRARQGGWGKSRADLTQGEQGKSPGMRALRRS
jgi:hypothetical protein